MFEKTTQSRVVAMILSDGRVMKVRPRRENNRKFYEILPIVLGTLSKNIVEEIIKVVEEDNARRFKNSGNTID